ncbi:hypothetical protein Hypma_007992 [Hypsizygus marmoreus]|uniref:Uncharacterized protein n=1 Tax=Hypsizygus marmoreus TaxID=39966 RepID=A0A369JSK2_HYPMA|nr:hypothetical protein Hypma_007992 [Hypsizygus marmoreus]
MMSSDVLANFSCLDELTQVIYQSVYRFVVLSAVSDKWTIHLGLAGPEGRWWRGSWTKDDILKIVGSKSSDKLLETFAEKLAEAFRQGELHIGDWSTEEGANIKLTIAPSSKRPMEMALVELSSAEAASHATDIFLDIALQAQSRRCHLHPDQFASSLAPPPPRRIETESSDRPIAPKPKRAPDANVAQSAEASSSASTEQKALLEIKALKAELDKQKQRMTPPDPRAKPGAPSKPLKGASLANPNKKARKYQAIEFESDEE